MSLRSLAVVAATLLACAALSAGAPGDDLVIAGIMVAIPGDANLDGSVDGMDLFILQANWCMSGATWGHGDFNYDTTVDFSDLLIVAMHFGESI